MSRPYILDDDRLAQALREVFQMQATLDMEEEVRKATEEWNRGARIADDHFCPRCGERGHIYTCRKCSQDTGAGDAD